MKKATIYLVFLLFTSHFDVLSQNLPSLLHQKNINSTFSIIAYDKDSKEWGIAVATDNICVGNSTIYIEPGVGAFSVIAETEPLYAYEGFEQLKLGKSITEVIETTRLADEMSSYRQVAGLDAIGRPHAFTGETLKYWNGNAGHLLGENYVVMGNQLAEGVLDEMAITFEKSEGTFAERLLKSLIAGQDIGGQVSGKQSAALMVKGLDNEWFNQIDLRVDHSKEPISDLSNLLNYHYGRIRLNQALYAINIGNTKLGQERLLIAEAMLKGWYGMYRKLASAYSMIGDDNKAVSILMEALKEKKEWKINLPSFFYLESNPKFRNQINPQSFSPKDWQHAIMMLSNLKRYTEAIDLANQVLVKEKQYSYGYYILGQTYDKVENLVKAKECYAIAYELDKSNIEAKRQLEN